MREHWRQGQLTESGAIIALAQEQFPHDPGIMLAAAVQALEEDGGQRFPARVAAIESLVNAAVSIAEDNAHIRLQAALVYFDLGDLKTSAKHAVAAGDRKDQLHELESQAALLNLLGQLAWLGGKPEVAEKQLRLAAKLAPEEPEHVAALAAFLAGEQRREEARELIERALDRHPGADALIAVEEATRNPERHSPVSTVTWRQIVRHRA